MTQEDKQLLLTDLCARLPYSAFVQLMEKFDDEDFEHFREIHNLSTYDIELFNSGEISNIKPYLRPMSSMTEEEREELKELTAADIVTNSGFGYKNLIGMCFGMMYIDCQELIDWLNKKMFDHRGLIPKGLAISTEVFNPYKD